VFAIITNKRQAIYGGALVLTLVLGLFSLFLWRGTVLEAIVGLILSILYIIIDTQIMIKRSEVRKDVFTDAKILFVDFVQMFIEILKLLDKDDKKDRKK
jgi:FtsH-binding integral membrane protein